MRIAMIGHKRYGSHEGGVEVVVTRLARSLVELGHEVVCYDRGGLDVAAGGKFHGERIVDGVRVVPVRTVDARGLAALTSSFAATAAAVKAKPDIVHYHAEGPCVPLPLAHYAGIRTVATIHGLDWRRAKWGRTAAAYIRLGERSAARFSDALIVLSQAAQRYFTNAYAREAHVIPNGVDPAESRPADAIRARWGLEEGSYLLFVGRLVPEKRIELLMEAFRGIKTDKRLVITGNGSDTPAYELSLRKAAAGDERVLFTGFVEGERLAELYSSACCYVLPSDVEGMSMSLLEAMSYGCCCITSDIPECADVIGDAGLTFRAGDAASLRDRLVAVLEDGAEMRSLGSAARDRVRLNYSWDAVVRRTLEVYREIAA